MTLIPLHVLGGVTAVVSGFIALYALKGAALHRKSGTIFVLAMLVMAASGVFIAIGRDNASMNMSAGLVTTYLVITGLLTVQQRSPRVQQMERGAMIAAFALAAVSVSSAVASGARGRAGLVAPLLIFALLVASGGIGDLRMIRGGGLRGAARIRRHLWRMSVGLFIASASFFLGPARRIPEPLRGPALRLIPFAVLATMAYWLWRYRRTRAARGVPIVVAPEAI